MSSETITLEATKRDQVGKKVKHLRSAGQTPAVIHDHGKESIHISVLEKDIKKVFTKAGKHHPVNLKVEGKTYTTLIKDYTTKPSVNLVYHTVFQAIKANETVKAEIPLKLIGEIPAERASLLVLQNTDIIEVEALPADLVDSLEVDATSLVEAGDKITVADIKAPKGITITTDPETMIATVEIPRDQIAEADAAAADLAEDAATSTDVPAESGDAGPAEGEDSGDAESTDEAKA